MARRVEDVECAVVEEGGRCPGGFAITFRQDAICVEDGAGFGPWALEGRGGVDGDVRAGAVGVVGVCGEVVEDAGVVDVKGWDGGVGWGVAVDGLVCVFGGGRGEVWGFWDFGGLGDGGGLEVDVEGVEEDGEEGEEGEGFDDATEGRWRWGDGVSAGGVFGVGDEGP